ncbi:hypothetical protein J1605_009832 [Eschrichtius robustus]|uniref:Uncharacterized protein n=1 Tax=Eschrichtius robustus TaxID=9764 RepID=A0AB34GUQ2_ESCRO|nr:hypothetical protein J1605_009832 [Eschrichtius robustus]
MPRSALQLLDLRFRAPEPQLLKPVSLEPVLCNKRSHCNEKPAHHNEEMFTFNLATMMRGQQRGENIWRGPFGKELRHPSPKLIASINSQASPGFPGGAVVENLPANAEDTGSSPGLGRSHMPRSGWAREPQLLSLRIWSLCSAAREAAMHKVRTPRDYFCLLKSSRCVRTLTNSGKVNGWSTAESS